MEISVYSLIGHGQCRPTDLQRRAGLTMTYFGGEKHGAGLQRDGHLQSGARLDGEVSGLRPGPARIRVNAVSAGPVRTLAGRGAGVDDMLPMYERCSAGPQHHSRRSRPGRRLLLSAISGGITGETCMSTPATTSWVRLAGCSTNTATSCAGKSRPTSAAKTASLPPQRGRTAGPTDARGERNFLRADVHAVLRRCRSLECRQGPSGHQAARRHSIQPVG